MRRVDLPIHECQISPFRTTTASGAATQSPPTSGTKITSSPRPHRRRRRTHSRPEDMFICSDCRCSDNEVLTSSFRIMNENRSIIDRRKNWNTIGQVPRRAWYNIAANGPILVRNLHQDRAIYGNVISRSTWHLRPPSFCSYNVATYHIFQYRLTTSN